MIDHETLLKVTNRVREGADLLRQQRPNLPETEIAYLDSIDALVAVYPKMRRLVEKLCMMTMVIQNEDGPHVWPPGYIQQLHDEAQEIRKILKGLPQ